jgi:hypothetical protein
MPFILKVLMIAWRVPRFQHPSRRWQIAGCVYPSPSPAHSAHVGAKWMYIIDGNRILAREFVFAVSNSGRQVHCCGYIGLDGMNLMWKAESSTDSATTAFAIARTVHCVASCVGVSAILAREWLLHTLVANIDVDNAVRDIVLTIYWKRGQHSQLSRGRITRLYWRDKHADGNTTYKAVSPGIRAQCD